MSEVHTTTPRRPGKIRTIAYAICAIIAAPFLILAVLASIVGARGR